MTPQERHALEIMEDKKADQEARRRILMRIEEDKRNRRHRKERERAARQHATGQDPDPATQDDAEAPEPPSANSAEPIAGQRSAAIIRQYEQRPEVWEDWATMPDELKTEWEPKAQQDISDAQLEALGIRKNEDN